MYMAVFRSCNSGAWKEFIPRTQIVRGPNMPLVHHPHNCIKLYFSMKASGIQNTNEMVR